MEASSHGSEPAKELSRQMTATFGIKFEVGDHVFLKVMP